MNSSESLVVAALIALVLFLVYLKFYSGEKFRSDPVWTYPQEYPNKALLEDSKWGIPGRTVKV